MPVRLLSKVDQICPLSENICIFTTTVYNRPHLSKPLIIRKANLIVALEYFDLGLNAIVDQN